MASEPINKIRHACSLSVQATSGPSNPAAVASIYHTVHTLILTLYLTLTLNLNLISSYLTNKHQYAQRNMSAY